jgi:catechol 2,3-dioxygenase-like lactoylglutathione lyase family enzyme
MCRNMIDHISVAVSNLARSIEFYDAAFRPLRMSRLWTANDAAGYGYSGVDESFAIKQTNNERVRSDAKVHIAFAGSPRESAVAFYAAAMQHGAAEEGGPGVHPEYGAGYFAAFVQDPDGNRLEAVLHERLTR